MFEDSVLGKIFEPTQEKETGGWRKWHNAFYDIHSSIIYLRRTNYGRLDGRGMWHASGKSTMDTGYWLENMEERGCFEALLVDGGII